MISVGNRLDKNRGVGPGFDFLRIFLSLSILLTHSYLIVLGNDGIFGKGLGQTFHSALVPMFFALSGFLITGSATRLSLGNFLMNRGARIIPALSMDIAISALILGPLLTTATLNTYFSSYEFRAYFFNLLGLIHYILPGVFEQNPFPATVNGSLWTIPFELGCYFIMSALIICGIIKQRLALLVFAVIFAIILFGLRFADFNPLTATGIRLFSMTAFKTAIHHFTWPERVHLYVYFLAGCTAYLWRNSIPYSRIVLAFALLAACLQPLGIYGEMSEVAMILPTVYVTVFIGVSDIMTVPLYSRGDYSYGIYLYGYPLQQALVLLFPTAFTPLGHFVVSGVLVTAVAMLSWHLFEKPILRLRKRFSFTARITDTTKSPEVASDRMTVPSQGMQLTDGDKAPAE